MEVSIDTMTGGLKTLPLLNVRRPSVEVELKPFFPYALVDTSFLLG
jgi:hypothetical protein